MKVASVTATSVHHRRLGSTTLLSNVIGDLNVNADLISSVCTSAGLVKSGVH
jgi:hypothetical protein